MTTVARRHRQAALAFAISALLAAPTHAAAPEPPNPAIDMQAFLDVAHAAAAHRETRRLSESAFIALAARPGTVVLDARSAEKFGLLHIAGAVNLSFPDMTIASLATLLPDPQTTVLIYCNNNFRDAEKAFPSKRIEAALNLSTYATLYAHGYRNIYELGPLLDPATSKLSFAGTEAGTLATR